MRTIQCPKYLRMLGPRTEGSVSVYRKITGGTQPRGREVAIVPPVSLCARKEYRALTRSAFDLWRRKLGETQAPVDLSLVWELFR